MNHDHMLYKYLFVLFTITWILNSCTDDSYMDQSDATSTLLQISEGTNLAMDVSHNSGLVVFDLQGTLWSIPITGGEAKALTDKMGDARQPSFSPDGKTISFQAYYGNNWQIYTINKNGRGLEQITHGLYDHREPSWAPDGMSLLMSSDKTGSYDIWQYNFQDKSLYPLTQAAGEEYAPCWSNTGDQLSYVSYDGDQYEIHIRSIRTEKDQVIYQSENKLYAPSWSEDDRIIYFVEHDWTNSHLMSINMRDKKVNTVSKENQDVFPFRVKHHIDKLFYCSDGHIVSQSLVDDNLKEIPFEVELIVKRPVYQKKVRDFDNTNAKKVKGIHCPKLSPDGRKVSFISLGDVWIKDLDTDQIIRVTHDKFVQLMPNWANDNNHLYFASDHEKVTAIYQYNLSDQKTLKIGNIATMPSGLAISPDNRQIAYTMAFGPRSGVVSVMDIHSGLSQKIGNNLPFSSSSPSWLPDGSGLAVSILQPYSALYREGIARVIYIDVETGEIRNLKSPAHKSYGARTNDNPTISADGEELLYISEGMLWVHALDQNGQLKAKPLQLTKELSDMPSWSEDGQRILYMAKDQLKILNRKNNSASTVSIDIDYQRTYNTQLTVIHAGTIIDVINNTTMMDKDILVQGNRIIGIEDHDKHRKSDHFIDAKEQFIIPGLIDIHAHQGSDLGTSLGLKWLSWGVTTTRDPATYPYDAVNRKEAQINGNITQPRIFFTGSPIDGNRVYYNGTYAQQSHEQVRRELERAKALDYDMIKTYVRLPDSTQQFVMNFAHNIGLPISSHELYPAANYGIDGVEHVMGTSRRGYTPKMSQTYNSYDDVTTIIAKSGMSFTPTIGIYSGYNYMLSMHPNLLEDKRLTKLESAYSLSTAKAGIKRVNENKESWKKMFDGQAKMIADIVKKGGLVVAGTDGPIIPYGFGLFVELLSYQEANLSPSQILQIATINCAQAMGLQDHLGSVETGKLADLVILNNNPIDNIMNLKEIDKVFLDGKVIDTKFLVDEF